MLRLNSLTEVQVHGSYAVWGNIIHEAPEIWMVLTPSQKLCSPCPSEDEYTNQTPFTGVLNHLSDSIQKILVLY